MMSQPQTYLFYDLETSGLNPAFDQILQFAAIRTDAGFQEISRHDFRIQLRPDIIPSSGALLTTDISILTTLATGICEYDAVREIHTLFNEPNTINVGYNSLSFDDAFLRFAFYRNLLPPYTHQFKDGCKRLDIFPITVLYWLQASPLLNWPTINGKPTLRLEHLSRENNLANGQAHDALVDVAATVELARRLRQDEAQWQACLPLFDKSTFPGRLEQLPRYLTQPYALLIHDKYGYDNYCQTPALYLGETNDNGSRSHWLRLDKLELQQTTTDTISDTTWIISKKAGEPPFVMPPEPHQLSEERRTVTRDNLRWLKAHPEMLAAITQHALQSSSASPFSPDVDAALYTSGFPSKQTEAQCREFHQADLSGKTILIETFTDKGKKELAERLMCRNYRLAYRYPSYAAYQQHICDEEQPLLDYRGQARLTPQAALADIEKERLEDLTPRQQTILLDLEQYIRYYFLGQLWEI